MASVTVSNPESHAHNSLVNVTAVTFNVPVTVKILVPVHVKYTVNRPRRAALGAIEGEIPTATAVVTRSKFEVPSKVEMDGSVCVVLDEFTVLQNKDNFHGLTNTKYYNSARLWRGKRFHDGLEDS